ncbi:hypothetical protein ACVME8_005492 [Bradyrhizobium diazoefficiens]|uniref:hypothetical protein n=1 Tax=Bradyrhizobium diazoefficiens TaxID=1355477 RepID=UPI00272B5DD8|nr:hypothetical protein [Bradyrhizobium diazoefficiens]WLA63969.1 hypothetical protein QNN01_37320 [Bradyrhizobium diazoefficiens]
MAAGKKVNASELESGIKLENEKWIDRKARREIQKEQLRRILTFFMWANAVAGVVITTMWAIEYFDPPPQPTITDKVIIAALAGITVQSGAIILSAFKGLFKKG